jgi:hypothetical protein
LDEKLFYFLIKMPYGRKSTYTRKATRPRTYKPRRAGVTRRVPVPRKKFTNYTRRNALAINQLSRITRQIKNMSYGSVQKSFQKMEHDSLLLDKDHPILFDGTDFTRHTFTTKYTAQGDTNVHEHGCRLFSLNRDSNAATDATICVVSSYFAAAQPSNPYFIGQTSDIVDGGQYKPLSAYYNFKFTAMDVKYPIFITITCMTVKPHKYVHSQQGHPHRDMPQGLIHMKSVADPVENRINSEFFKVYSTKRITIVPPRNTTLHTCEQRASVGIHPKKVRTQLLSNPTNDDDTDTEHLNGNYGSLQTPFAEPYWILISSSQDKHITGHAIPTIHFDVSRNVTWRDRVGAA